MFLKNVSLIDDVQSEIYWKAMFQDDDDDDVDVGINDTTGKMDIKPTIWQGIAIENQLLYLMNINMLNECDNF